MLWRGRRQSPRTDGRALTFKGDGYTMQAASDATTSGKLTVGVISDIKEFLPETVHNLKAFAAWIKAAGAGLVVVNGDVAYSQKEMESVLRVRTEFSVPVLVTSGNKESHATSTWRWTTSPQIILRSSTATESARSR